MTKARPALAAVRSRNAESRRDVNAIVELSATEAAAAVVSRVQCSCAIIVKATVCAKR